MASCKEPQNAVDFHQQWTVADCVHQIPPSQHRITISQAVTSFKVASNHGLGKAILSRNTLTLQKGRPQRLAQNIPGCLRSSRQMGLVLLRSLVAGSKKDFTAGRLLVQAHECILDSHNTRLSFFPLASVSQ